MSFGLNKRLFRAWNYDPHPDGWSVDDAGHPQVDEDNRSDFKILANLQPMGRKRRQDGGGSLTEDRIWGDVFPRNGKLPCIIAADNVEGRLATRICFGSDVYEVQIKKDWSRGLLGHISIEAEMIVGESGDVGPSTAAGADPDTDIVIKY
jgi:hypothetical protein